MKKSEVFIPSADGKNKLHTVIWEPDKEYPRAVLQIVHGMSEYVERYNGFASFLTKNGFAVIGNDHLGHGKSIKSDDDLGFFASNNGDKIVIKDLYSVLLFAKDKWQGVPVFILGHSMGSFFVRQFITEYSEKLNGAIVMGTGFIADIASKIGMTVSNIICKSKGEKYRSKMLEDLTLGSNNKPFAPNRTPDDWLSRDEKVVDDYVADRLCGFRFTARAYNDFFKIIHSLAINKNAQGIVKSLPILITSGEVDPVGGKKACEKLLFKYESAKIVDTSLKLYPNDRHEILNELDKETVYKDLADWMISKL